MKRLFKNSSERRQSQEETRKVSANVVQYVADVSKTCNKECLTWRAWDKDVQQKGTTVESLKRFSRIQVRGRKTKLERDEQIWFKTFWTCVGRVITSV